MAIPIKLQVFEGPMDLLMHLIEKNKIDIYDIPIVTITDQYLDYVRQMERDDMNVTSEFLVMAATLLEIKSRMLLPKEEDPAQEEEDPREELVQRLLEYKMYKYMSEELRDRGLHAESSYYRPQNLPPEVRSYVPPINYEELIGDRTAQSLQKIFEEVMRRKRSRVDPVHSGFGEIHREELRAADKELYIRAFLEIHPHTDFQELLESQHSKAEVIVTFLVILELMKNQKIRITQEETFGKITIDVTDEIKEHKQDVAVEMQAAAAEGKDIEGVELLEPAEPDEGPAQRETGKKEEGSEQKPTNGRTAYRYHRTAVPQGAGRLGRRAAHLGLHRGTVITGGRSASRGALARKKAAQRLRGSRIWHRKRRIHGISTE